MAYARAGFGALAGQGRAGDLPALYVYTTTDAHTAVGATGGTRTVTMHVVVSNASGVVDISDGTTIGAVSDSD